MVEKSACEEIRRIVDEYGWSRPYDAGSALAVAIRVEKQTALALKQELEDAMRANSVLVSRGSSAHLRQVYEGEINHD